MARSFVYNRPLDAKILPNDENSGYEFQFNTLLEIKKEVDSELVDMELGLSSEASGANSSESLHNDHDRERESANTSEHQRDKSKDHPKLVIKFRDLWRKSEHSADVTKKRKKSKCKDSENEISTKRRLRQNKRRRFELSVSSESRITRSSLSRSADHNKEVDNTSGCVQQEVDSDKEGEQNVWNVARITRLKKHINTLCESCGMCFNTNRQLQAHQRYYTADGEFHCTLCDIRFSRNFQLSRHVKIAHSVLKNEENYKYKCHLCIDRFERKVSLIAHVTHLHNKHLVSNKKSINPNKERTLLPRVLTRRKEKRASARITKRTQKHRAPINSMDRNITSTDKSGSTNNSNESDKNSCYKDENLTNESTTLQQSGDCPGNQLLDHSLDLNNKEANANSNQHLMNTPYSEHIETSILEKSVEDEVEMHQKIQPEINNSTEKPIEPRDSEEIIDDHASTSKQKIFEVRRAVKKLQQRNEGRNRTQHPDQVGLDMMSEMDRPQLGGELVDHLGNKVGNWCVSVPLDQLEKNDHVSGCSSVSTIAQSADRGPKIGVATVIRCTRSSAQKANILNTSAGKMMNSVTDSDQMVTQNEKSSMEEKNTNNLEYGHMPNKVHPHLDNSNDRLSLSLQDQPLDQQVGSVLSHQLFEAGKRFVNTDETTVECNNVGIGSSTVNDFGVTFEPTLVSCKDEEISNGSWESISVTMAESSSNVCLTNSLSLESQNISTMRYCNTPNNPKIRDVRVVLVKLENTLDLSQKSSPTKLSPPELGLIKTEKLSCDKCDKQFESKSGLLRHSKWTHINREIKPNRVSRLMTKPKSTKTSTTPHSKVLAIKNRRRKYRIAKQSNDTVSKKLCHLCHKVFQNNLSAVSHYLSVHTEFGVFQCCLCYAKFKNSRQLKLHLYRNCNGFIKKDFMKFCIVCKKELSIPSSSRRCSECNQNFEYKKHGLNGEQFLNTQNLTKHHSALTEANEKVHALENRSDSLFAKRPVPISKESEESIISVVDHESAKNDSEINSPTTCAEIFTNLKCLVCNCVFFESSQLRHHLLTAHTGVEYCKCERCQNVIRPQTHLTPRDCKNQPKRRCKNKKIAPKFRVGKKTLKSKDIRTHDKLCQKKLYTLRKRKILQINSKNSIRQPHIHGNTRPCYDYKCDVCGLNCCCRTSLKIHKARYLKNGNNVCNICGLTFASKHVLVLHMKTAHNPKILFHGKIRCEICNQGFYKKKFHRIHLAHSHNIQYYQCKVCRIRFNTYRRLNNHSRYYSKNVSYLCNICGQTFECKYLLEYHTAEVHNPDKLKAYKYFCDMCNCAFLDELLLQAHIGHFHNMQDRKAETNVIKKDVCKATVQPPEDIDLSIKSEISCVNSDYTMSNSIIQEQTNEIHCDQDGTDDIVGKAIRTHASSEYKCSICKLSFNDPYAILNHEWEFSNDGIYTCDVCNRKFMTSLLLMNHKIKHYQRNVIRKYECYVCKEDFLRLDDLKMHGLHLHGPQFVWEKGHESTDNHNLDTSESGMKRVHDDTLKKLSIDDTYDTVGLVASNKVARNANVLLFQKIQNNRSAKELLRRRSNEDAYCCNFCQTNCSSASLLKDHIKKHAYRAYYTNSSRYLCLICKDKFRTNDILRAHVIYYHTSKPKKPNLSDPGYLEDPIPDSSKTSQTYSNTEQSNLIQIDVGNITENLPARHMIQNQPSSSEKRDSSQQLNDTSSDNTMQLSISASDVDSLQNDCARRISSPRGVVCTIDNDLGCQDLSDGDGYNFSSCNSVESGNSEITSHIESASTWEEVEFFTIKVKDVKGLEKLVCTICIEIFHSVAHFRKHFAFVHVKNGSYLCTFCGEIFSFVSDLRYHTLKHKGEAKNYVCCNKNFKFITDFVRHKLSHDRQSEEKQREPSTQLLPFVETGSIVESNTKSNVSKSSSSYKCEICDNVFVDLKTMLKHWEVCIGINGLQCDLCRATFRSLNSLRVHKMTHHKKKQNCNTVWNRPTFRVNGDQALQTSTQSSIAHDGKLGSKRTIDNSVNISAFQQIERTVIPSNKFSKQNELLKFGKIKVKQFARLSENSRNTDKCHVIIHQEHDANDTSSQTKPRLELRTKQPTDSSKQRGVHKTVAVIPRTVKSTPQVSDPNIQVLNKIRCNASGNRLMYHIPVRDPRILENERKEQRLPTSQSISKNSSSFQSIARRLINNKMRIASSKSVPISHSNKSNDKGTLQVLPASSNATGSSAYYICLQSAVDSSNSPNNAMVVPSGSGQNSQQNDCSDKMLSSLVPLSLNPGVSPTYFLCVKPNCDKSCKSTNHTGADNDSDPKSNPNDCTITKLLPLLKKPSSFVLNPVRASDIQRIVHKPNSNSSQNVVSNVSSLPSHANGSQNKKVPILRTSSPSTHGSPSTLLENATKAAKNPANKSASDKEFISRKQIVRCSYCKLLFTEKAKLIEHMESHRVNNQCSACGLTFSNESALEQHLHEHRCSTCTNCNMKFFFGDSNPYRGILKYCYMCNSLLPTPKRQFNRSRSKSAHRVMKCGICMNTFATITEMSVHFNQVHLSFLCGICDSKFSRKKSLHTHMQTHGSDSREMSQCKICKKYFVGQSDLLDHELSHQT